MGDDLSKRNNTDFSTGVEIKHSVRGHVVHATDHGTKLCLAFLRPPLFCSVSIKKHLVPKAGYPIKLATVTFQNVGP